MTLVEPERTNSAEWKYLEIVKRSILNEIYLDDELRLSYLRDCFSGQTEFDYAILHDIRGAKREAYKALQTSRQIGQFPERDIHRSGFSHTMVGRKRLDSLHACLDHLHNLTVPGDLVECGVWRGGCCILMAAFLDIFGIRDRRVIVADSFDGLPKSTYPEDIQLDLSKDKYPELAVSLETVRENFKCYGLPMDNVVFLKGWFSETLPTLPAKEIALLRIDGDLYESTKDCLVALYDKVVEGGIVIIDDWGVLPQCRKAVEDYFAERHVRLPDVVEIDWSGVYWFKENDQ